MIILLITPILKKIDILCIIQSLIEELVEENEEKNFCILWACPGKGELHRQSYENVKTYVAGNPVCSLLEEDFFGSRQFIKKHEIVFVNWEKLVDKDKATNTWINNLMRDQEGMNFIDVLAHTNMNGTRLVLVIDESHIGKSVETRIQELKNEIIKPDVVLEMSATPLNRPDVTIDTDQVVAEGMIKNDIIVNEGITDEDKTLAEKDTETIILEKGYNKRLELVNEFKKVGAFVNPLVLIQIPNVAAGEAKKIAISDFLRPRGITVENGKLKYWTDNKANFDKKVISNNDDITEFLVFKTAVATGWDCPRAHILIKFRETQSETFEIQTIGRILRTPEAKSYGNDVLDNAYIYTNSLSFASNNNTYNPNKLKTEFSYFRSGYDATKAKEETELMSFYRSREGNYNAAGSDFHSYFLKEFKDYFGIDDDTYLYDVINARETLEAKGLKIDSSTTDRLLAEASVETKEMDMAEMYAANAGAVITLMADNDVQAQYYELICRNLNGLAQVRSKGPINSAIIDAVSMVIDYPRSVKVNMIQKLVLNNQYIFESIINRATLAYRQDLERKSGMKGIDYVFTFDDKRGYYYDTHLTINGLKSLYQPLYVLKRDNGKPNQLEKSFLDYLDMQNVVRWYFENGAEVARSNFGIPYNNRMSTFQPDFIIKFKNGWVGIFDTKAPGERVEDTTVKAEALNKYIQRMNTDPNHVKLVGGIIVKMGKSFYYHTGENYIDINQRSRDWKPFTDLLQDIENDIHNQEYLRTHRV